MRVKVFLLLLGSTRIHCCVKTNKPFCYLNCIK